MHTDRMTPTKNMIIAARRAEFDYYQKGRALGGDRFIPTPDAVIKAMLDAALKLVETPEEAATSSPIVTAAKPTRRR